MDLLGLEVKGVSVGGVETCLLVPTWKLAFDMGSCSREAVNVSTVLFTHAHIDHMGALATHAATRELWGLPPARYVMPPSVVPGVEQLLAAWRTLDGASFDPELVPLGPGESLDLGKGRTVTAFRTVHRVVSQAYVVSERRKRLRPELVGLPGQEIAAKRTAGEPIDEVWHTDELAFSGDTRIEGLTDHPRILACRRLMLEVTFLDERVPVDMARKMGHIHLDEVVRDAALFRNEALLFTHRSARFSEAEAQRILADRLPPGLAERVQSFDGQNP